MRKMGLIDGSSALLFDSLHEIRLRMLNHPRLYLTEVLMYGVEASMDIENLTQALREGPYGRCAYECDNDVCDHQVVNFEFASGATATLTMIATSERLCERETKVCGSTGAKDGPYGIGHVQNIATL